MPRKRKALLKELANLIDRLPKCDEREELERVIRELLPELAGNGHDDEGSGNPPEHRALSPREHEIMLLVFSGKKCEEIARTLGISPRTVEQHRRGINKKFGTHNTASMCTAAFRRGLVPHA